MEAFEALLENICKLETNFQNSLKELKAFKTELKKMKKHIKKPRSDKKNRKEPSGFNKPGPISKDLAKFLGVDATTEIARTEVTKKISEYIKSKELQNAENKREFSVDDKLAKLFGVKKGTSIKYFGLQGYLKTHYLPREAPEVKA